MAVTVPTFRKICQHCGKEFIACYQRTEYCSTRCAKLADKQRKRNERLKETQLEVRERERLALLDKNWLTLSDAARLMQMSRTTLYKVIADHGIELKRFSARTVRIARADLEKVTYNRETQLYKTAKEQSDDLGRWMTREQVMEKYDVTYSWFYSVLKKRGIKSRIIGSLGFYDKEEMHRVFSNIELEGITEWYTFEELRQTTGMRTESISDFCLTHKVPRMKKNGITYVSKKDWDNARGNNIDRTRYYTVAEITEKYQMSSNHLFHLLKEHKVPIDDEHHKSNTPQTGIPLRQDSPLP